MVPRGSGAAKGEIVSERLTASEVSTILGVPVRSVYALPIPRYTLSARRIRWDRADLEEYLRQCRSPGTNAINAGGSTLTVRLAASEPDLANSFRKHGVLPRRERTTKPRKADSTPLRLVSP